MNILITGGCGFVGSNIAMYLKSKNYKIDTLDNLSRKGSFYNLSLLKKLNIKNYKIDVCDFVKIKKLKKYDLIIDCCAEAAVEVSKKNIDKVFNTNLFGTLNILKKAKIDNTKIIFISSSRVYPLKNFENLFKSSSNRSNLKMFNEKDNLYGARTLYGFTKLASEMMIEEFSYAFKIKYIINRCGVISGPLQFGKQDQGFVSLWIWNHLIKKNMSYIGYGGQGYQIRDVLHIIDLCELILLQIKKINKIYNKLFTIGGSKKSFTTLKNLTSICEKFTNNNIKFNNIKKTSVYDIPYYISDNKFASKTYGWKPKRNIEKIVNDTYLWLSANKSILKKYF
tara:strand:- start:1449 stop:2462 length:1014 start_codon:yes stop_codon:yes gene_type:complete